MNDIGTNFKKERSGSIEKEAVCFSKRLQEDGLHADLDEIKKDSSNAMIQFAQAIGVLVLQEEETMGIRSKK